MTPSDKLLRRFRPEREIGPNNPLPGQIFDPVSGDFLGYEPQSMGIPGNPAAPAASLQKPTRGPGWGPKGDQPNPVIEAGEHLIEDVTESLQEIKDTPSTAPYSIRDRIRDHLPVRNPYERPK